MSPPLEHKQVAIDTLTWTPLVAPFACNNVSFQNSDQTNAVKIRTDNLSSATELTIPAGGSYDIVSPKSQHPFPPGSYRFSGTIAYAQAVAGTGPIVGIFCI